MNLVTRRCCGGLFLVLVMVCVPRAWGQTISKKPGQGGRVSAASGTWPFLPERDAFPRMPCLICAGSMRRWPARAGLCGWLAMARASCWATERRLGSGV